MSVRHATCASPSKSIYPQGPQSRRMRLLCWISGTVIYRCRYKPLYEWISVFSRATGRFKWSLAGAAV